jgi:methionyl aminopeptidase
VTTIGTAVERSVSRRGYHVIPQLGGHGIGRTIHEAPAVPNFPDPSNHDPLARGLVLTVEPLIAAGVGRIGPTRPDGWTLPTRDGSLSAHVEHTVIVTTGAPLVLTRL